VEIKGFREVTFIEDSQIVIDVPEELCENEECEDIEVEVTVVFKDNSKSKEILEEKKSWNNRIYILNKLDSAFKDDRKELEKIGFKRIHKNKDDEVWEIPNDYDFDWQTEKFVKRIPENIWRGWEYSLRFIDDNYERDSKELKELGFKVTYTGKHGETWSR